MDLVLKKQAAAQIANYLQPRGNTLKEAIDGGCGATISTTGGDYFFCAYESGRAELTEVANLHNRTFISYAMLSKYFEKAKQSALF